MTPFLMLIVSILLNGFVGLGVYSIRSTIKQQHLETQNTLLVLEARLGKEFREEFATKGQVHDLRERVDLSNQIDTGFTRMHRAIKERAQA